MSDTGAIAIIGAGIGGLAAARRLAEAGRQIVLFEKSRGVGGRIATRRTAFGSFDHGAQYITARSDRFRAVVDGWVAQGHAASWLDQALVGVPAMTAPMRALAAGLDIRLEHTVQHLAREDGSWRLHGPTGPIEGGFSAVLIAAPAPQALALARSAGVALPGARAARIAPCWALMLAFDAPLPAVERALRPEHDVIAWIAASGSKPGRDCAFHGYVAHATPAWSSAHLELSPAEAEQRLLGAVSALCALPGAPRFSAAHRWRYALVEAAADTDHLWDDAAKLGACGDWCIGPRVESAFLSGEALAQRVLAAG